MIPDTVHARFDDLLVEHIFQGYAVGGGSTGEPVSIIRGMRGGKGVEFIGDIPAPHFRAPPVVFGFEPGAKVEQRIACDDQLLLKVRHGARAIEQGSLGAATSSQAGPEKHLGPAAQVKAILNVRRTLPARSVGETLVDK